MMIRKKMAIFFFILYIRVLFMARTYRDFAGQ